MQSQLDQLVRGMDALGLTATPAQQHQLLNYADELLAWNARINLTAITRPAEVLSHHLLDCLAIIPHLPDGALLDVGSGGGLPGLVIAIMQPEREILSIDSRNKKIAFQRHAARQLGLQQFSAQAERIEAWRPERQFPLIISRAFSSLQDFTALAGEHLAAGGQMLAMKGKKPNSELQEMKPGWQVVKMPRLVVPGLDAERRLLVLERNTN